MLAIVPAITLATGAQAQEQFSAEDLPAIIEAAGNANTYDRTIEGKPFKALLLFRDRQVLSFSLDYFAYFSGPHDIYVSCPVRFGDQKAEKFKTGQQVAVSGVISHVSPRIRRVHLYRCSFD
jgi:hypothetical protein